MARAVVERRIDMPRAVVWDALVDPVLVEGWLHPSARLLENSAVLQLEEPSALVVASDDLGEVAMTLIDADGGSRGSSTDLRIEIGPDMDAPFLPPRIASWSTRLDQLEDLLRGHPVDWEHWEQDRGADYAAHLADAEARIAR